MPRDHYFVNTSARVSYEHSLSPGLSVPRVACRARSGPRLCDSRERWARRVVIAVCVQALDFSPVVDRTPMTQIQETPIKKPALQRSLGGFAISALLAFISDNSRHLTRCSNSVFPCFHTGLGRLFFRLHAATRVPASFCMHTVLRDKKSDSEQS